MSLLSSCICLCPIHWSHVLSREWRCSWSSADRRCSNYIWVINKFIVWRAGLLWSQQDFDWRWSVPLFKCLTVLEFSFILFDLCLLITFFNFIMNYVPIVTFWIFTYHKIWILSIMFCFYPRPVLASGYCRCLCLCVCACVCVSITCLSAR